MAGFQGTTTTTGATSIALDSYETALCWIPEPDDWAPIDRLRNLYDKAYEKWPPHINMAYPFVAPEKLHDASQAIQAGIKMTQSTEQTPSTVPRIHLDSTGVFTHRQDNTIYLCDGDHDRQAVIARLRSCILEALGHGASNDSYQMHLTVGQSQELDSDSHHFLLQKASLLPKRELDMGKLHILLRERITGDGNTKSFNRMKTWGIIDLKDMSVEVLPQPTPFYSDSQLSTKPHAGDLDVDVELEADSDDSFKVPYTYDRMQERWVKSAQESEAHAQGDDSNPPSSLTVASYNVLAEFTFPVSRERFPVVVQNLLEKQAASDVLVLQEVTDDFLTYLLGDNGIRERYPYVSHGPPHQDDIEPLASHLNIVVLGRLRFSWRRVTFQRRHKSSIIAQFPGPSRDLTTAESGGDIEKKSQSAPLVLAAVHLTCGLTDGSVTAKKLELQAVLKYLRDAHPDNPWVLAGDFNMSTSAHTIDMARKKGAVSAQTVTYLRDLETQLFEAGLVDAWAEAKIQRGDGGGGLLPAGSTGLYGSLGTTGGEEEEESSLARAVFEGEEGATYDPIVNELAAEIVGSGFNMRPQRYDRILVKGQGRFHVAGFNMFGQRRGVLGGARDGDEPRRECQKGETGTESYGSDHWGVRCSLRITSNGSDVVKTQNDSGTNKSMHVAAVQTVVAPESLSDVSALKECLANSGVLPVPQEAEKRERALKLLREVVLQSEGDEASNASSSSAARGQPSFVIVPVGSYGLGVWTPSSDVDCLCIGPVSSHVFFSLATQRLRRAEQQQQQRSQVNHQGTSGSGIRLLRRVNAQSGMMLELEVLGVKMDLQYCASAFIAETWPLATRLAPSDPVFQLSSQALAKLKPMRDLFYLRRTAPDLASSFRAAYHLIRLWARQRGIYSARFGYLGGIHISIMLSRVCKMMWHNSGGLLASSGVASAAATTVLVTFFEHYAQFDWKNDAVFDPFFHNVTAGGGGGGGGGGRPLRYVRTAREPLAILGWHGPMLNVATAASVPSTNTIAEEFRLAAARLREDGMTWSKFVGTAVPNLDNAEEENNPGIVPRSVNTTGAERFLASYKSYVKIEAQFWGVSLARGTGFIGWLESRCTLLLVDLDRRVPGIHARIWPARFVDREDPDADQGISDRDYRGYYLAGLELDDDRQGTTTAADPQYVSVTSSSSSPSSSRPSASQTTKKESLKVSLGALKTALDKFESQIRGDEKYFDARTCWMSASVVSRWDLGGLKLDEREWGEYTIGDDEDDEDDEEDEEDDDSNEQEEADLDGFNQSRATNANSNKKKKGGSGAGGKNKNNNLQHGNIPSRPAYEGRFRSSADVMSRLRWDPDLDSSEYIVGYEDRFLGVKERPLDAWKSEQTDEEFIPQHRIVYFKRRVVSVGDAAAASSGDGGSVIVWDRRERKDEIFGSGVSSLSR